MKHCRETSQVQEWLDGEMPPDQAARFEAHVAGCDACREEAAAFRALFGELRTLPLLDPRPELFDRIMREVLPQHTPRWVRALGWTYAGALAASIAAIGSAVVLPGPSTWLHGVIAAGMRSLTGTGTFVLRSLSDGVARFGETLSGGGSGGRTLRLLWTAVDHPTVWVIVAAAVGVCAGVLWWMRPRERSASGEMPHVGLLGL